MKTFLFGCICLTVLSLEVFSESCPTRWSTSCTFAGKRCRFQRHCDDGELCCHIGWCGGRCSPSGDSRMRQELAPPSRVIDVVHAGRCNRGENLSCNGIPCSSDGSCRTRERCCRNACGRRTCSPALRSSVFSIFRGK